MPKRKRDYDLEYMFKKMKKLERKVARRRRHRSTSSSSSDSVTSSVYQQENEIDLPGSCEWYDQSEAIEDTLDMDASQHKSVEDISDGAILQTFETAPPNVDAATSAAISTRPPLAPLDTNIGLSADQTAPEPATQVTDLSLPIPEQIPELDSDFLAILGEDPTSKKNYGPAIQKDLAIRLNHIVTSGLSADNRKELVDKYLLPENCKLMKAPTLNPEIKASFSESQIKRDKAIENKQNMVACALSSLSTAITHVLSSQNKNAELLKLLMDAARTLGHIQYSESVLRRFFALSTMKKDMKDQLEKTKIDEMLFGSDLAETLKSAKIISKAGEDMKMLPIRKSTVQSTSKQGQNRALNYRAPHAVRKPPPAGGARGARAAPTSSRTTKTTSTHATQPNSSRTSWRRQQGRHYRR